MKKKTIEPYIFGILKQGRTEDFFYTNTKKTGN